MLALGSLTILSFCFAVCGALSDCPSASDADYDFVVVGAGAGGGPLAARLAESGYSVLLVDAGHDTLNVNTTIPAYFLRSLEDPQIDLDYTYDEYPDGFPVQRDDSWYPRARALGGSTIHNAMINIISGTRKDFDGLAAMFDDPSWSRDNMQKYFAKLEKNLYLLPLLSPDHGFDGWLKTSPLPIDVLIKNPAFIDLQLADVFASLLLAGLPILDTNSLAGDAAGGVATPTSTTDENHVRSSVHERLLAVQNSSGGKLTLALDTLATRVLLCNSTTGASITAYGVEIAPGAALPVASNFNGKSDLQTKTVTARHEVILSAGAFQSPQLLMLSGIGDATHLQQHGIQPIVNLPGVGLNLQDHDEIATIFQMKQNYTILNGCKFLFDPTQDPCLDYWNKHGHANVYAFNAALTVEIRKTSDDEPVPNMLIYTSPAYFPGFFRGAPQDLADHHSSLTAISLLAHPSSKGTVRLTGSHPQDKLDIQKLHFQNSGAAKDLEALRSGIRRVRDFVLGSTIGLYVEKEVSPGANATSDDQLNDYIYDRVFGHHACCTNPIGPDSDPSAVLDGDFKVRGVDRLRVVDASSWPQVPGFFIATPTYMISEKAADVLAAAAKQRKL